MATVFITLALLLNGMGFGPFRRVLKHMNSDVHVGRGHEIVPHGWVMVEGAYR